MAFDLLLDRKLVDIFWSFGVVGVSAYTHFIRLLPTGRILNSLHRNETFWQLDFDRLVFLDSGSAPTTVFTDCDLGENGQLILKGSFVGSDPIFYHYLEERINHHKQVITEQNAIPEKNFTLIDVARNIALGDILLATPGLRELKRANPGGVIRFYTGFVELVSELPYIDEVYPYEQRPTNCIELDYVNRTPAPVHLARLFGDQLGVEISDVRPDCVVSPSIVSDYLKKWKELPHPRIVIVRSTGPWTPNKKWPDELWKELVPKLCEFGSVIEVGNLEPTEESLPLANYLDLRGKRDIRDLIGIIAAAELYVGPDTGPLHIAAAVQTPAVVIVGGYLLPVNTHYDGNVELHTEISCSPCFLTASCPFDRKCLRAISVDDVVVAVNDILGRVS